MSRPARAVFNLDALKHNYRLAKQMAGNGKVMAVVKADAYRHGAIACSQALADEADGFAVACIEEALELREAGIQQTILILEGFFEVSELDDIARLQLDIVIQNPDQLAMLERTPLTQPVRAWLKMDSGMHRVGFLPEQYRDAWYRLRQIPWVHDIVLMSHLSCADDESHDYTLSQLETFELHTLGLPGERSIANSAGLIEFPQARSDWSRPGLMLYGASPFQHHHPVADQLKPVMELHSAIISIKEVPSGVSVGYSGKGFTTRSSRLGTIAMGYADGYPLHAGNGTPVLVNGRRVPIIGRVSMDMMTVDLTGLDDVKIGDPALLWGESLSVNEVAQHAHTIPYQLFCNFNRVPVSYKSRSAVEATI